MSHKKTGEHAIFPGSFDPFTNGHMEVLKIACKLFRKVTIVIADNENKKSWIEKSIRKKAIKESINARGMQSQVNVIICKGILVDLVKKLQVSFIVRGVRDSLDMLQEERLAAVNSYLGPNIQTIYIRSGISYAFLSSSLVRVLHNHNKIKHISRLVPKQILLSLK